MADHKIQNFKYTGFSHELQELMEKMYNFGFGDVDEKNGMSAWDKGNGF